MEMKSHSESTSAHPPNDSGIFESREDTLSIVSASETGVGENTATGEESSVDSEKIDPERKSNTAALETISEDPSGGSTFSYVKLCKEIATALNGVSRRMSSSIEN